MVRHINQLSSSISGNLRPHCYTARIHQSTTGCTSTQTVFSAAPAAADLTARIELQSFCCLLDISLNDPAIICSHSATAHLSVLSSQQGRRVVIIRSSYAAARKSILKTKASTTSDSVRHRFCIEVYVHIWIYRAGGRVCLVSRNVSACV